METPTATRTEMTRAGIGAPDADLRGSSWRMHLEEARGIRVARWFTPQRGLWPWIVDGLMAAVVGLIQVAGTIVYSQDEPPWDFDPLAIGLLVVGPLALLVRRRLPTTTVVVTFVAVAAYVSRPSGSRATTITPSSRP